MPADGRNSSWHETTTKHHPMSCCGQGRAALRARAAATRPSRPDPTPVAPAPVPQPDEPPPAEGEITVIYLGTAPLLVRGLSSGRTYTFSPARRVRHVPPDDGAALLLDALFERHGR
jgi:hypothetical protein